jgi:hypothetical protein
VDDLLHDAICAQLAQAGGRADDDAMAEDGDSHILDVIWEHVLAAAQGCLCLRRAR